MQHTGCACREDRNDQDFGDAVQGFDWRLDKYRRSLATLTVNGEDVAAMMIGEGLARPYHGERREGWCLRR